MHILLNTQESQITTEKRGVKEGQRNSLADVSSFREFTLFIIIMNIHEPLFTLKAKDYTFVKVIGTGHYSQVY